MTARVAELQAKTPFFHLHHHPSVDHLHHHHNLPYDRCYRVD